MTGWRHRFGAVILGVMIAGCGSSTSPFNDPSGQADNFRPVGMVFLQGPVSNAPVTFLDDTGSVIGTSLSTSEGEIPGVAGLPGHFLVTATDPHGFSLAAEVEAFQGDTSQVVVNLPTTFAHLYHLRHPELTSAQVEQKVLQFFEIPPGYSLRSLQGKELQVFSIARFLQEASSYPSVDAFLATLLAQVESGGTHKLTKEPSASVTNLIVDCALDLAKAGLEDALQSGAEAYVGWVCESLGFNNPFPSLSDIARQLDEISQQITQLSASIARGNAQNNYNQLVDKLGTEVVQPITNGTSKLQAISQQNAENPVVAPVPIDTFSSTVSEMTNLFAGFLVSGAMNELSDYLVGATSIGGPERRLERLLSALDSPPLGLNSRLSYMYGYSAFNNTVLKPRYDLLDYYMSVFQAGANLAAEQIHLTHDHTTLVANIRIGQQSFRDYAATAKLVEAQLPEYLPVDDVFLDREHGLMWYTGKWGTEFHQRGHKDAVKVAANFPGTGPYTTGWRLPTKSEVIDSLYKAIIEPAYNAQSVPNQKRSQVLLRLGWDLSYMDNDHRVWCSDDTAYVSLDTGFHSNFVASFHNEDIILVRNYGTAASPDDFAVTSRGANEPYDYKLTSTDINASQVKLGLSCQVTPLTGLSQTVVRSSRIDVTDKAVWSSSDDSQASVSNFPGSEGVVTWHAQINGSSLKPVTITASYYKEVGGNPYNRTIQPVANQNLSPPTGLTPHLDAIGILPSNVEFGEPSPNIQKRFTAVLFYLDPVSGDARVQAFDEAAAPPIVWSLTTRNNQPLQVAEDSGFQDGNLLVLRSTLKTADLNVHAKIGTVEAIVPIHVAVRP